MATNATLPVPSLLDAKLHSRSGGAAAKFGMGLFGVMPVGGVIYIATKLSTDLGFPAGMTTR